AALGTERYFFDQFETYLNRDAVLFGAAFPTSLEGQLGADASGLVWALLLPLLYFGAMAALGKRWIRPSRRASRVALAALPLLLAAVFTAPCSFRVAQA